jgi:hypothetical protein
MTNGEWRADQLQPGDWVRYNRADTPLDPARYCWVQILSVTPVDQTLVIEMEAEWSAFITGWVSPDCIVTAYRTDPEED